MLDEYVLVPDVFDPAAYSNPAFIEMCLPHLKEPLFQEALVRDLCDGGWRQFCHDNSGNLHRLCKEILKKLLAGNRLRPYPLKGHTAPNCVAQWCQEGLVGHGVDAVTGIIAAHSTKQNVSAAEVASIEKLTGTPWWQNRSPSLTVDRKTASYRKVLHRVFVQANSLMFIDPNLDPSQYNYREFHLLFAALTSRKFQPRIEIHRSFCKGDGKGRTFPTEAEWQVAFTSLATSLKPLNVSAEVFLWDDFHDRYLIADIVGVSVPAGFDVTSGADDWSTWGRLGREDKDKMQRQFDPAARAQALKMRFSIGAK